MEGCQVSKKNDFNIKTLKVELEKLVCTWSYDSLESSLLLMEGITDIDLDRELKTVYVDYDPMKISEKQIIEEISRIGCRIQEF